LEEIFTMVNKELKLIGKERLLPAGAVITGGTAKLPGCVDLAKNILALPSQTGFPIPLGGLVDKIDDPAFATVVGLILWGLEDGQGSKKGGGGFGNKMVGGVISDMGGKVDGIKKWFGKFLP
jgi:cell division protein FtsA